MQTNFFNAMRALTHIERESFRLPTPRHIILTAIYIYFAPQRRRYKMQFQMLICHENGFRGEYVHL